MPHTEKPPHRLTESIDQLERIREELLRILGQRLACSTGFETETLQANPGTV